MLVRGLPGKVSFELSAGRDGAGQMKSKEWKRRGWGGVQFQIGQQANQAFLHPGNSYISNVRHLCKI